MRFPDFLKLSPFKIGCLVVLASALLYISYGKDKPRLLAALDNRIADTMFQWRGAVPTTGEVVIVDIDEKSLKEVGQWPWPRNVVAELVAKIGNSGAKVVGLDIVFAEQDRTSPKLYLAELEQYLPVDFPGDAFDSLKNNDQLDHDVILGNALASYPTILGYVFQIMNDGLKNESQKPFPSCVIRISPDNNSYDDLMLRASYRAIVNVDDIAQAESEGFLSVFPDLSGTVRNVPLIMELDAIPYPSLALEMLRVGLDTKEITIHVSQQAQSGKKGLLGVELAGKFVPTNELGEMMINYRGPARTFPYVSAVDVLNGRNLEKLANKYVLVGTSSQGLFDLRATPYSNIFAGVEIQANIIDNVLKNDPLTFDIFTEIGLTITLIVIGGIILSALLAYANPIAGALGGLVILITTIAGNYYLFFLKNQLLGVTYPLITALAVFLTVSVFNYFFEGREKRFINRAFSHYVSPQIVNQLRKEPKRLTLAGEQKNLTVLFSDIRDFTTISENMDSGQLGQFMNEYLTAMSNIVIEHNGMVDKFIGDAVMAIWGAPLDDADHAANAVRAAFHMKEKLEELRPAWTVQGLPHIEIGVGINTGIMSVGNFGSDKRFDYTVMGDNVNLASRLEGLSKMYGSSTIISEFTREVLGSEIFCRFLDMVKVKGKDLPAKIYEPLCIGEPEESLKREVLRFEEAITYYQNRQFDEASRIFEELHAANPLPLYKLYRDRVEICREAPPSDDWTGCFTFTTK